MNCYFNWSSTYNGLSDNQFHTLVPKVGLFSLSLCLWTYLLTTLVSNVAKQKFFTFGFFKKHVLDDILSHVLMTPEKLRLIGPSPWEELNRIWHQWFSKPAARLGFALGCARLFLPRISHYISLMKSEWKFLNRLHATSLTTSAFPWPPSSLRCGHHIWKLPTMFIDAMSYLLFRSYVVDTAEHTAADDPTAVGRSKREAGRQTDALERRGGKHQREREREHTRARRATQRQCGRES